MKKHIINEKTGINYTLQGNYYIPDLVLPPETDDRSIGIWGNRHKQYLKENKKAIYTIMLMNNTLHSYLADLNEQAEEMFIQIVNDIANAEGITEQLKADNQMEWVRRMHNIRSRATEIVNNEFIYI